MTRRRLTPRQRSAILAAHGGLCWLCKRPVGCRWDVEHMVARALLGSETDDNLAPAHRTCHRVKSSVDVREWAKALRAGAKHRGEKRPKGTIRSAGFPKHLRKRMNGTVERRIER
tara:strand:+ start:18547 stop:18891 length:345 start_codon:yes stop_codon:yes gene_type:complete